MELQSEQKITPDSHYILLHFTIKINKLRYFFRRIKPLTGSVA